MTPMYQRLLGLIGASILAISPVRGDVLISSSDRPDVPTYVSIFGFISKEDVAKVAALMAQNVPKTGPIDILVNLDSDGGDIDAAMEIGRLIRKRPTWTQVLGARGPDSACASACVLIMSAGSNRLPGGRIGIHRPFSTQTKATGYAESTARYAAMATRVKAYLEEMGMPSRLYEEMIKVPAEQVRWLTIKEQEMLAILGKDPAYEDAGDSQAAAIRGISKQEWLRRKALAQRECGAPPPKLPIDLPSYSRWGECLDRIYGSSPSRAK